jgi:hypothetical protein
MTGVPAFGGPVAALDLSTCGVGTAHRMCCCAIKSCAELGDADQAWAVSVAR